MSAVNKTPDIATSIGGGGVSATCSMASLDCRIRLALPAKVAICTATAPVSLSVFRVYSGSGKSGDPLGGRKISFSPSFSHTISRDRATVMHHSR